MQPHRRGENTVTQAQVTPVQYMTVAEVAEVLRLSAMTIYRMVNGGQLEAIRTGVNGRTIRILATSVNHHQRATSAARPVPHIPGQTEITG
jgi:excisionase family DNA binding protein